MSHLVPEMWSKETVMVMNANCSRNVQHKSHISWREENDMTSCNYLI